MELEGYQTGDMIGERTTATRRFRVHCQRREWCERCGGQHEIPARACAVLLAGQPFGLRRFPAAFVFAFPHRLRKKKNQKKKKESGEKPPQPKWLHIRPR